MKKLKLQLKNLPKSPGVYIFKGVRGKPVYVGKSTNVRERVKSHLSADGPKAKAILEASFWVESIPVKYELEALLLEAALIKKHKPIFNSRAKDDKHPLYIKITKDKSFSIITTSRREAEKGATYYGPFPSSRIVREVLRQIRKVFPFHSQKVGKKPCFWSHLGLCRPCPAEILTVKDKKEHQRRKRAYQQNIKNITKILSGKTEALKKHLRKEMEKYAKEEDFEGAAARRDQLAQLAYITTPYRPATAYLENPNLLADIREKEIKELFEHLKNEAGVGVPPKRIECYDISHLQGDNPTASMVTFVEGEPEKNLYRHFRIRGEGTKDDFSMMKEVVKRRLGHLDDWGKPDLIVVDGGKPQLKAAMIALREADFDIQTIALAKREEEVIVLTNGNFKTLRLPRNSAALKLLQRIRDEAHRFARSHHLKLRLKSLGRG